MALLLLFFTLIFSTVLVPINIENGITFPEHVALDAFINVATLATPDTNDTLAIATDYTGGDYNSLTDCFSLDGDRAFPLTSGATNYERSRRATLNNGQNVIYLLRRDATAPGDSDGLSGIWWCQIPDVNGVIRTINFGLYWPQNSKFNFTLNFVYLICYTYQCIVCVYVCVW